MTKGNVLLMKKGFWVLILLFVNGVVACDGLDNHPGEAEKTSESKAMRGRDCQDVIEVFEIENFTIISTKKWRFYFQLVTKHKTLITQLWINNWKYYSNAWKKPTNNRYGWLWAFVVT